MRRHPVQDRFGDEQAPEVVEGIAELPTIRPDDADGGLANALISSGELTRLPCSRTLSRVRWVAAAAALGLSERPESNTPRDAVGVLLVDVEVPVRAEHTAGPLVLARRRVG